MTYNTNTSNNFPLIFLKFRVQNYFLFSYKNIFHNNFLPFLIPLKYYFFTYFFHKILIHLQEKDEREDRKEKYLY